MLIDPSGEPRSVETRKSRGAVVIVCDCKYEHGFVLFCLVRVSVRYGCRAVCMFLWFREPPSPFIAEEWRLFTHALQGHSPHIY